MGKTQAERNSDHRKEHNLKNLPLWLKQEVLARYQQVYEAAKAQGLVTGSNPASQFVSLLLDAYENKSVLNVQPVLNVQEPAGAKLSRKETQALNDKHFQAYVSKHGTDKAFIGDYVKDAGFSAFNSQSGCSGWSLYVAIGERLKKLK